VTHDERRSPNRILQYNPWLTQPSADQGDALDSSLSPGTYPPLGPNRSISRMIAPSSLSGPVSPGIHPCLAPSPSRAPNILYLNLEDPLLRSALGRCRRAAAAAPGANRYFIQAVFLTKPST